MKFFFDSRSCADMLAHSTGIPLRPWCEADAKPEVNFLLRMTTDPAIWITANGTRKRAEHRRMVVKTDLGLNRAFSVLIDTPATRTSRDSLGGADVK